MVMMVFSSEDVEVYHRRGKTDYVVIAFAPFGTYADGKTFWGKPLAERADISMIGVMPKEPLWYPRARMSESLRCINSLTSGYRQVITYGTSMGGHGALKYADVLKADVAIAICVQHSINPDDVGRHSKGNFFRKDLMDDMLIVQSDAKAASKYLFFDPLFKEDELHNRYLQEQFPDARFIRMFHTGHDTIQAFASSKIAKSLIEACSADDELAVRSIASQARRASVIRREKLAKAWDATKARKAAKKLQKS